MIKVVNSKAISYCNLGTTKLGELTFENSTPFETAITLSKMFSARGIDTKVVGEISDSGKYSLIVCYADIEIKIIPDVG